MTGNCFSSSRVLANSLRVVSAKRRNPPEEGNQMTKENQDMILRIQREKLSSHKLIHIMLTDSL